jgi:hypothetical protein
MALLGLLPRPKQCFVPDRAFRGVEIVALVVEHEFEDGALGR